MKNIKIKNGILNTILFALVLTNISCSDNTSENTSEYGELSGIVKGTEVDVLPVIYAYNTDKDVGYTVFVVDGEYKANHMIAGNYDVTLRPAVGQLKSFSSQTHSFYIDKGDRAEVDFTISDIDTVPNYVGGMDYPDAQILPYDEIYPAGPGRDILERTCHGCHTANFYSYNAVRSYSGGRVPKNKDTWAITVDRMHKVPAFGAQGNPSMFDPKYLTPEERDVLVDYLADNFGPEDPPKVIQLEVEPELDLTALKSAMFIEYIYHEPEGKYPVDPWPHQVDFDLDGNVWLAYTSCCIVKFDPRTGEQSVFEGHGGGHGIAVDQTDGSVWYSGDVVRHLDPETGLVDNWKSPGNSFLGSNTQIFDSKGNLWLSLLGAGALGKWERETDTVKYWDVPVMRSRPYGIVMDHNDKVWFADYHNNGVTRFDPDTEKFKHFNLIKTQNVTAIRRLGADSKNMIWAGTWGNIAFNNSSLYKLNPETEEVTEYPSGIPYGAIYNAEADNQDNIWIAPDNYVSKFDQTTNKFTHYPIPTRSDSLKTTITRDGGVWFIYRNAGKYAGYGGSAVVLYPDMNKIETLAAYHDKNSAGYALSGYQGPPSPKAKGLDRPVAHGAQNEEEYKIFALANGLIKKEGQTLTEENPE